MPQFQYKQQQFQQDAVSSVTDMFQGVDISRFQRPEEFQLAAQNTSPPPPLLGKPYDFIRQHFTAVLEDNLKKIQERNNIHTTPFDSSGDYLVLDTQMETGTGKTFTFINTIFELHKQHNLTHFIIIVPSIAIKEGIKKSFDTTQLYFEHLYQRRIQVYEMGPPKSRKGRKSPPSGVMSFVHNQQPTVLIMTNHAFNSENNLINQELEGFYADNAPTPMDAIAAKAPVLIIDEPQRVEGKRTIERIKDFKPLCVLRYSATFREGQIKNLVYVLDSYDAFDKKLVKGITVTDYKIGRTDTAFLGVRKLSRAGAELEAVTANGKIKCISTRVEEAKGESKLFKATQNPAYRDLRVTKINLHENTVDFSNGQVLKLGEYIGREGENDNTIAEVMLRDTINKHLQKERELFSRNIKCLSLIFIDRVKDYRDYENGDGKGYLQELFERCYEECKQGYIDDSGELSADYREYLKNLVSAQTHGGYFSGDAGRNQKIDAGDAARNNETARKLQQEITDLILRDKEKILDPTNELRFIFAHSALREGWDNPNVFQICKLRTSYSETSVVQEVGRGLRICVDGELVRQDQDTVGNEFTALNRLDVFTLGNGEFIGRLQRELGDRCSAAKARILPERLREIYAINAIPANKIYEQLYEAGCIDEDGYLLDIKNIGDILSDAKLNPSELLESLPSKPIRKPDINDGRDNNHKPREYRISQKHYQKFKKLWKLLHQKVIYEVRYSDNFENEAVERINAIGDITPLYVTKNIGRLGAQEQRFTQTRTKESTATDTLTSNMMIWEFLSRLAEKTHLPRNSIIRILSKVDGNRYQAMQKNPFLAIEKVANAINKVIYKNIVDNIRYHKVDGLRKSEATITLTDKTFTAAQYIELESLEDYQENPNNLWEDIAPYDSDDPERIISENSLGETKIIVFAKLPRAVNIPTPMHSKGVNPDFAFIVQKENEGRRFYFVAEAKPTTDTDELNTEEERRIEFTEKYFEGIDAADVQFKVVSNYSQLLQWFQHAEAL